MSVGHELPARSVVTDFDPAAALSAARQRSVFDCDYRTLKNELQRLNGSPAVFMQPFTI